MQFRLLIPDKLISSSLLYRRYYGIYSKRKIANV